MGWNNPPVPWREFERRLSWRQGEGPGAGEGADEPDAGENESRRNDLAVRPVTQLPVPGRDSAGA